MAEARVAMLGTWRGHLSGGPSPKGVPHEDSAVPAMIDQSKSQVQKADFTINWASQTSLLGHGDPPLGVVLQHKRIVDYC